MSGDAYLLSAWEAWSELGAFTAGAFLGGCVVLAAVTVAQVVYELTGGGR